MPTNQPPIPTRGAIYCRMSRDREGAGLGIDRQREDCEALAKQLGLEVVDVYADNDMSAYSGKPRKDYQRLLADIRAGLVDVVISWHTDRLHRRPLELEEYIDVCEPRRIETRTVKAGHLDLSTATGRMIARQLGVQARYEVERMIERAKRARDQMAEQGKHFGGRRPFGWKPGGYELDALLCPQCGAEDGFTTKWICQQCETKAVLVDGSEAALVAEAADAVLAGASLRSIAVEWNERGILTSTGNAWAGPEVGGMLRRPRNAGIVVHRGQEASEAGKAKWPAILDEGTWRSIVALLDNPERRTTPGNERKYLGSNIYLCGVCGATMRASTSGTGQGRVHQPAYRCRTGKHVSRRRDLLDDYVTWLILERVSRPDAAELLAEREDPIDVRGAQKDMREARETLNELAAELGAGRMDMQEWRAASQAAKKRLAAAEDLMGRAVQANPVVGLVGAEDPEVAWNRLDLSRKRAVISYLMTVRVMPARQGRIPGGGVYFDTEAIGIEWRKAPPAP